MTEVSSGHYALKYYVQRMTTKEWRDILLEGKDEIVYRGNFVKLTAKKLGYGVVEVRKELEDD